MSSRSTGQGAWRAALACVTAALAIAPSAFAANGAPDKQPAAASPESFSTTDHRNSHASAAAFDALETKAGAVGTVSVMVGLQTQQTPEGALSASEVRDQRAAIARETESVRGALQGTAFSTIHTYETVPYVALEMSRGALQRLEASGKAASVQEDKPLAPTLAQSVPLIEGAESRQVGRSGSGAAVAILDTGVDKAHAFFGGRVVSEACYSARSSCPGGVTASTASGSAVPCTYSSSCDHGTHVAGIAAGLGSGLAGVAPSAKIIAIQVFSQFSASECGSSSPCPRSFGSDQLKGLERVLALKDTYRIGAANLSLGGGLSSTDCDSDPLKPGIDNLRSVNIATAIAAGNDGSKSQVSFPGCISTAVTVGSTTKTDGISSFSNSSNLVELLAPGTSINASVPGGGFAVKSGTSMATPHVTGAFAVLRGINASFTVPQMLSALQATGRPVTDTANNVTKPRIRLLAAGSRLADSGLRYPLTYSGAGYDSVSDGVGLATRMGASSTGTIRVNGIPSGASVVSARLIWQTIGGADPSVVFGGTALTGVLTGAAKDACWNINQAQPVRTYTADVTSKVTGNGSYTLSGVGGSGGIDGEGASVLVVYKDPTDSRTGTVALRIGASTVDTGHPITTALAYSVPSTGVLGRPKLHVGMGDGQSFADKALVLGGVAVTPVDVFSGSDRAGWDDDVYPLPSSLFPAGSSVKGLSNTVAGDCLTLGWAAPSFHS